MLRRKEIKATQPVRLESKPTFRNGQEDTPCAHRPYPASCTSCCNESLSKWHKRGLMAQKGSDPFCATCAKCQTVYGALLQWAGPWSEQCGRPGVTPRRAGTPTEYALGRHSV